MGIVGSIHYRTFGSYNRCFVRACILFWVLLTVRVSNRVVRYERSIIYFIRSVIMEILNLISYGSALMFLGFVLIFDIAVIVTSIYSLFQKKIKGGMTGCGIWCYRLWGGNKFPSRVDNLYFNLTSYGKKRFQAKGVLYLQPRRSGARIYQTSFYWQEIWGGGACMWLCFYS